jgi:hypothetical protein
MHRSKRPLLFDHVGGGQYELKDGALRFVPGNPQPTIMGLDDQTADRQTPSGSNTG